MEPFLKKKKDLTEFVTILLLLDVLVFAPRGMWYLRSPIKDGTLAPCLRKRILGHWKAREVLPISTFLVRL